MNVTKKKKIQRLKERYLWGIPTKSVYSNVIFFKIIFVYNMSIKDEG